MEGRGVACGEEREKRERKGKGNGWQKREKRGGKEKVEREDEDEKRLFLGVNSSARFDFFLSNRTDPNRSKNLPNQTEIELN